MMATKEISRNDWIKFFNSFSDRHQGWLISLEVMSSDLGDQVEVDNLPLEGIAVELGEHGEEDTLAITAGKGFQSHITRLIEAPQHVWLKQAEDGADEAVEIEGKTEHTLLHLRTPIRTELVDGYVGL